MDVRGWSLSPADRTGPPRARAQPPCSFPLLLPLVFLQPSTPHTSRRPVHAYVRRLFIPPRVGIKSKDSILKYSSSAAALFLSASPRKQKRFRG